MQQHSTRRCNVPVSSCAVTKCYKACAPPLTRPASMCCPRACRYAKSYGSYNTWQWASTLLPCLAWLRTYNWRKDLVWDIVAGISVGTMVVPQGMSYANIAGALVSDLFHYVRRFPCAHYDACPGHQSEERFVVAIAFTKSVAPLHCCTFKLRQSCLSSLPSRFATRYRGNIGMC